MTKYWVCLFIIFFLTLFFFSSFKLKKIQPTNRRVGKSPATRPLVSAAEGRRHFFSLRKIKIIKKTAPKRSPPYPRCGSGAGGAQAHACPPRRPRGPVKCTRGREGGAGEGGGPAPQPSNATYRREGKQTAPRLVGAPSTSERDFVSSCPRRGGRAAPAAPLVTAKAAAWSPRAAPGAGLPPAGAGEEAGGGGSSCPGPSPKQGGGCPSCPPPSDHPPQLKRSPRRSHVRRSRQI